MRHVTPLLIRVNVSSNTRQTLMHATTASGRSKIVPKIQDMHFCNGVKSCLMYAQAHHA